MKIAGQLSEIQRELKSPKDQKTNKYRYRSIDSINEAVKPLASAKGCAVVYSDSIEQVGEHLFLRAKCTLMNGEGEAESALGYARIDMNPQYMSVEQATGAASSYARKYAACGLFAIDDSEIDPDRTQPERDEKALKSAAQAIDEACKMLDGVKGKKPEEWYKAAFDSKQVGAKKGTPLTVKQMNIMLALLQQWYTKLETE